MTTKPYVRARDKFAKHRVLFSIAGKIIFILPPKIRLWLLANQKSGQGLFSIGIRYILLKSVAESCGDAVGIYSNVYLLHPQKMKIGSNVTIQPMSYIEASGGLTIENDVSIAHGVTIMTETHNYANPNIPFKCQGMQYKSVFIGEDTWIGAKASILAGVHIGKKAVIGANSVVTKDIPDYAVAVGSPARVIKYRGSEKITCNNGE